MANLYKTDGSMTIVQPKIGKAFSLEELQEYVGGYVETFPHGKNFIACVNEDGLRLGLPHNDRASVLCMRSIVDDLLVCTRKELG